MNTTTHNSVAVMVDALARAWVESLVPMLDDLSPGGWMDVVRSAPRVECSGPDFVAVRFPALFNGMELMDGATFWCRSDPGLSVTCYVDGSETPAVFPAALSGDPHQLAVRAFRHWMDSH